MSEQLQENTPNTQTTQAKDLFTKGLLDACIHCGMCLPACPTYLATGRETESPRGRIQLLQMWNQGQVKANSRLFAHIDSCLGCMGCTSACPSGVNYEAILSEAKPKLVQFKSGKERSVLRFVFAKILPDYPKLRRLGQWLRLWQQSKMPGWFGKFAKAGSSKVLHRLANWQSLLPPVPVYEPLPKLSWQSGEKAGSVQFFAGCVMDIFYNHVNHACIRLLGKQRKIVNLPQQTCCGALAMHSGEIDIARNLAKTNIEYFEATAGDIVVSSAGCGAMLKEYDKLFLGDPQWHKRAEQFSLRVKDILESLAEAKFYKESRPLNRKVSYHAACHLCHVQKIRQAPQTLLSAVAGLKIVPLNEAEHCCGSAGIYNLLHPELANEVLSRKIENIEKTGAEILLTSNPGCLLQISHGLKEAGSKIGVEHLVCLLDEAYAED